MIINLISGPRTISTALMYSFAQRDDTQIVDEPYYAYYLKKTNVWHPGRAESIASMPTNLATILQQIYAQAALTEVLFLKNMAHHLIDLDLSFLKKMKNLFLIRDPHQLIASFTQVIEHPTMRDIGTKRQLELFEYLAKAGHMPTVLDSGEVLKNPEAVLRRTCEALGIAFDKKMLNWEAGPRPEDGVWAKYWYKNVHRSTGFIKQPTSDRVLPQHCEKLYLEAKPYYDTLYKESIKATINSNN